MTVIIFNDNIIAIEADDAVASIDLGDGIKRLSNTTTTRKVSLQSVEATVYYTNSDQSRKFGADITQSFIPGTTVTITGGGTTDIYLVATGPDGNQQAKWKFEK
ncbi:hypothetical protein DIS24_g10176 [Lasiodiplodia hormozganensis]|uniref:Uncharacterized protein n=1 Tax=Lasiodiplodia hormozganensis TaxID=869390 RepID=A0AA40CI55_9PEZI|nr:hypothetical protein DIS24_g10176 [Lasiodiplodia hormozganensis]